MKLLGYMILGIIAIYLFTTVAFTTEQQQQQATPELQPIVETKKGTLGGVAMKTDKGKWFSAFRNIPYAKPPIGNLRFRPPENTTAWDGVYEATKDGKACMQFDQYTNKMTGQEDCLYLNVYTPNFNLNEISKLPVMVFIHGGGFTSGNGASFLYGPQRLMDKDIILVTFNYRLSAFGFLCTEDEISPGNYGLLDQVQVLQWVQENIGYFGGDSNRVTIFGESAGGVSITLHLVSPLSKDLFHAAIIQSGTAICDWALQNKPLQQTALLAQSLDCPTKNTTSMVDCLKQKPALHIALQSSGFPLSENMMEKVSELNRIPPIHFKPVINHDNRGFLSDHPKTLIKKSNLNKVPIMIGVVNDEGLQVLLMASRAVGGLKNFNEDQLHRLISILVPGQRLDDDKRNDLLNMLKEEYYLSGSNMSNVEQRITVFSKVFSDIVLTSYVDITAKLLAETGVPTYAFKLTHRGRLSTIDSSCHTKESKLLSRLNLVAHMDDLQYLFHCGYFESSSLTADDQQIADIMLDLWSNFAKTKIPSLANKRNSKVHFDWTRVLPDKPCYLNISLAPQMVNANLSANPNIKQIALQTIIAKDEL